jgi:hypothetical protein
LRHLLQRKTQPQQTTTATAMKQHSQ